MRGYSSVPRVTNPNSQPEYVLGLLSFYSSRRVFAALKIVSGMQNKSVVPTMMRCVGLTFKGNQDSSRPQLCAKHFGADYSVTGLPCLEQVGVDGKGKPSLSEMTAAGVSYEPVGAVSGLSEDAMEHGGMRELAAVRMFCC